MIADKLGRTLFESDKARASEITRLLSVESGRAWPDSLVEAVGAQDENSDEYAIPLVIGDGTWETAETLGRAIASAVKNLRGPGKVVIVASSDLSHFYGDSQAEELDAKTLRLIEAFDAVAFHEELQAGRVEACGGAPIVTAMLAAQALGATVATTLSYNHSGKVMGDSRSVVGYGAVRID